MIVFSVVIVPPPLIGKEEDEIEEGVVRAEVDDDTRVAVLSGEWRLDGSLACGGATWGPKGLRGYAPLVFGIVSDAPMEQAAFADRRLHGYFDGVGRIACFDP